MFSSNARWYLLIALLALFTPMFAFSAPVADVEVHFHRRAGVVGEKVVLGDVATIYARDLRVFEKLSGLVIGQMPADRSEWSVPSDYVKSRVEEIAGQKTSVRIHGPEMLAFYPQRIHTVMEGIAAQATKMGGDLHKVPEGVTAVAEVFSRSDLNSLKLEEWRLVPGVERPEWRGDMSFRLEPRAGDAAPVWVNVKFRWFADAWVARKEFGYQKDIDASAFRRERVELERGASTPLWAADEAALAEAVKNARAKRTIREGMVLSAALIDRKPDARSGQKAQVIFVADSGLRVMAEGVIVADGIAGDSVRARLVRSKKIVQGKLTPEGTIEVSL